MITGRKAICQHTGFSWSTIRRLSKEKNFPLIQIAGKPCTSEKLIENWLMSFLQVKKHVNMQKGSISVSPGCLEH